MSRKLVIHRNLETNDFELSLDGAVIEDIRNYTLTHEGGKTPQLTMSLFIVEEIEVQL